MSQYPISSHPEGRTRRHYAGRGCGGRARCPTKACGARTAKACGPVPPTLGSTPGQKPGGRRLESPVLRGERAISCKTIAQGRPGRPGRTCMLVCVFLFCTRDRGCGQHPAFPAPSSLPEGRDSSKARAKTRRENAESCFVVIASAAKQSRIALRKDSGLLRRKVSSQ